MNNPTSDIRPATSPRRYWKFFQFGLLDFLGFLSFGQFP